jgi:hypothetical protein
MIEELAESALEELKRADHSIYVSLKYTRTVDIIKNTIKRLLSAYDISIIQGLEYAKEKKKISSIPASARQRADLIIRFYPQTKKNIKFYHRLKNVDRAEYTKKEEYRKNVALIAKVAGKKKEVNMELLKEYFDFTVCFVRGMIDITSKPTFPTAQKTKIIQPIKKKVKKVVKKVVKTTKKSTKKKTPAKKSYKINPAAPKRYGFY